MSDSPNGKYYIGFAYNRRLRQKVVIPQIISGRSIKGMMVRTVLESNLLQSTTSHPKRVPESQYPLLGRALRKQDMTDVKKYLWSYEVYAYTNGTSTKTTPIIIGVHGQNGADGDSGIIVSPTAPENPKAGQLWQTASGEPIKRWDGSRWVLHYVSVEFGRANA